MLKFNDYLINHSLNESLMNEKLDISNMINSIKNIKDKKGAIKNFIKKFNSTTNNIIKKNIVKVLIFLYIGNAIVSHSSVSHLFNSDIEQYATQLSNMDKINPKDIKEIVDKISPTQNNTILSKLKPIDTQNAKISNKAINLIKKHEKLSLKAYNIGDGMITIGYGHATPKYRSKYKIGDKITKEEAYKLFERDLKEAEDGVKRIFKQWENEGKYIPITQGVFDAMVSMAFNIGVTGLRRTQFIQTLKNKNYEDAAELIKSTRVSKKFPGLYNRRQDEYNLFVGNYV